MGVSAASWDFVNGTVWIVDGPVAVTLDGDSVVGHDLKLMVVEARYNRTHRGTGRIATAGVQSYEESICGIRIATHVAGASQPDMEAVIGDVHIARDDDARVLRKGRQNGRTYRRVRRRSADGSLYKLVAIRVVHNLRIRGIPNLDGRICSRHIRFRDNNVSTRIYDYRV